MISSPNRGAGKKKWAVNKVDGPLVCLAEFIQKKLSKHYWPCRYEVVTDDFGDEYVSFYPIHAPDRPSDFENMLNLATRIVASEKKVDADALLNNVYLHGLWHVAKDKYGRLSHLKRGPAPEEPIEELPF